jgi:ATP-dependent protease ClpP protease subunit
MKIDRKILAVFLILLVLIMGIISCQNKDKNTPPPSNETPIPESSQQTPHPSSSSFEVKGESCYISMTGEIDEYTVGNLTNIYNTELDPSCKKDNSNIFLSLNSKGGNLEEAIKAGEFIRQHRFWTSVRNEDSCVSACVIMYLGGVWRMSTGKFGLHRPYSTKMSTTETEAKANYEQINGLIRQYFIRMNIPERLLDVMNSVPPDEIKCYDSLISEDRKQLTELFIIGEDPVDADRKASANANILGISKQELYLRRQRSSDVCSDIPSASIEHSQCIDDVMHGRR